MIMEDTKIYNKDIYIMHVDLMGAFNAEGHRIMFKHMRQLGITSTFVGTCEQLYNVSTTDYITPYDSTPFIDINRGTLHGDTLSAFLFTLCSESFFRWLTVGSRGYRPGAPTTNADPPEPTATFPGHRFADDLSLATGSLSNMTIKLIKLFLVIALTRMHVNVRKSCITVAL
jgi:hypothetical protein